jgi:hypothetical protein
MRFPVPEDGYREALSHFNSLASLYERANSSYGWSEVADRWVRDNYVEANIDTDFFDWQRIDLPYREAVASYYAKKYPELPISAEPRELKYFFSASEFSTSAGSEFSRDGKDEKEIYAFNLGAWSAFRNCLIEHDPDEAAHLATVISEQTANDWRPVGRRDIKDPLLFLKRLQAGVAVRENVRFTLYRLQR